MLFVAALAGCGKRVDKEAVARRFLRDKCWRPNPTQQEVELAKKNIKEKGWLKDVRGPVAVYVDGPCPKPEKVKCPTPKIEPARPARPAKPERKITPEQKKVRETWSSEVKEAKKLLDNEKLQRKVEQYQYLKITLENFNKKLTMKAGQRLLEAIDKAKKAVKKPKTRPGKRRRRRNGMEPRIKWGEWK